MQILIVYSVDSILYSFSDFIIFISIKGTVNDYNENVFKLEHFLFVL